MLACKSKYFHNFEDYDKFSIYVATTVYMRIIKGRLRPKKTVNEDGTITVEPGKLKSILNYLKNVLYVLKILYQQETFNEVVAVDPSKIDGSYQLWASSLEYSLGCQGNEERKQLEIVEDINELPNIIQEVINETPYKTDKLMSKRLYTSCLLTILKSITLSKVSKDKLAGVSEIGGKHDEVLVKLLSKERASSVTLWKLPDSMRDYVEMLTNKIREKLTINICATASDYEIDEFELDNIMKSMLNNDVDDYEED